LVKLIKELIAMKLRKRILVMLCYARTAKSLETLCFQGFFHFGGRMKG